MRETTVTIERPDANNTGAFNTIARHIPVQVDQQSLSEVVQHQQAYGFTGTDLFKVYTLGWNATALIRRGDRLIDELTIDPETGTYFLYVVTGRPKDFQFDHQEVYAGVYPGQ